MPGYYRISLNDLVKANAVAEQLREIEKGYGEERPVDGEVRPIDGFKFFDEYNQLTTDPQKQQFYDMALMLSIEYGLVKAVRYLLNFPININGTPTLPKEIWANSTFQSIDGRRMRTMLGQAAHFGQLSVLKFLIYEVNVDVNAYSTAGYTALHEAVSGDGGIYGDLKREQGEIAEFLIKNGADPGLKDKNNHSTPFNDTEWCRLTLSSAIHRPHMEYHADKIRPILTKYQQFLEEGRSIQTIKPSVQVELQETVLTFYGIEKRNITTILEYLAYDVDASNLNKPEEQSSSILNFRCSIQ